jgi:DNA polymerase
VAAQIPGDLAGFVQWWMTEPALDNGRTADRVPPRGPVGAATMILVPEPEREDGEHLLSGPQGRLLKAMLAAIGIDPEQTYFASILPRHMPHADWLALHAAGFSQVLARHISLAAPQRLISFTGNILPLLGHDPANNPAFSREFHHEGNSVPMFAARELAALIERPRWKAGFWKDWLDWTAGENPLQVPLEIEES